MNCAPGRRSLRRMSLLQRLRDRTGIKLFRGHEVVGNRIAVPQAHHVAGPADLARAVREFADAAPCRDVENPMEVSA
jgi:hypothetical protein